MKRNNRSDHRAFVAQQHKIRGLVSVFRSRKFSKDRRTRPASRLRSALNDLLLSIRVELHPSDFSEFLQWTNHFIETQLPDLIATPIGYDELSGVFVKAPVADVESELLWMSARINVNAERISMFRRTVEAMERLVFGGRIEEAIECLQTIVDAFGSSLWAVQLRIALEQQAGGLERQKRYVAEVRRAHKQGLLGFVAYHTSVLNEERTTLNKYLDELGSRIARHQHYSKFVKTYAHYRLAAEWPTSEAGLADVLRVEQNHTLIDVYETFVSTCQEILRREHFANLRGLVSRCVTNLTTIADFRLTKIAMALGVASSYAPLQRRSTEISDFLFDSQPGKAARASRRILSSLNVIDPWQLIYAGSAFAHFANSPTHTPRRPKDLARLVGLVMGPSDPEDDSLAQLNKLAMNFRELPTAAGILDFLKQLKRSYADAPWSPWLIGMNSSTTGIEDMWPNTDSFRLLDSDSRSSEAGPTENTWKSFHYPQGCQESAALIGSFVFAAAGKLNRGQLQEAVDALENSHGLKDPLKSISARLLIHAHFSLGHRQKVIALIADEGTKSKTHRQLTPIRAAIGGYTWPDYKPISSTLAPSIALHLLWSDKESDAVASLLRFAVSTFLRLSGARQPSKLFDRAHDYTRRELLYFLRRVCIPNIIDVSRALRGSREVMEERQAVCAALRLLDPANTSSYAAEVASISNQMALEEGQWIVDRTRIHVDTEALSRWATRELAEDFARYRDLSVLDVNVAQKFDDILKEILSGSPSQHATFTPEGEADTVLISILHRLSEEFLSNAIFGLDFYLSKRIRHQSFIGLIRGPLEFSHLITTRNSESGDYHRNDYWLDKFSRCSMSSLHALDTAFRRCAAKFDETLISAKDSNFHIRSDDHPSGLLSLDFTPQFYALARTVSHIDSNITDFVNTVVALLWGALEPSLSRTRRFIASDLKTTIASTFDELRAAVRSHAEDDPAFLEFDMEVGRKSTEVQRALDEAASWFTRADIEMHRRRFRLDQVVKIATDSALKCQRSFEPEISSTVESGDLQMVASALVFVHDVLFVALDNVRAHSGLPNPRIELCVKPNIDEGTLTVDVRSKTKVHNRSEKDKELQEIRDLIKSGTFERRTRKEGRSGFLKLGAVVSQSTKGRISFGFNEVSEFYLTVVYSMIVQPSDQTVESCG